MKAHLLLVPAVLAAALAALAAPAAPTAAPMTGPPTSMPAGGGMAGRAARGPAIPTDQPGPKTGGWMTRHNNFVETAKKGGIDLYFEGDSITDFWVTEKQAGRGGAPDTIRGKRIWDKEFLGWKAADFGISGDTTQNVIYRIQNGELDGVKPKVVVLMIGTNNSGGNTTAEDIAKGVTKIVDIFKEKQPQAKILLLAIFPRNATADDPTRIKLNKVNDIIAKLDDGKQVKYLNINDKFLDKDGTLSRDIFPDLLHPNDKGYQIWADAIKPQLTEWLGPLPATQPAAQ